MKSPLFCQSFCHSHVNGNPILLFVNNWKALYFVNQWKVLFVVIPVETGIQYFIFLFSCNSLVIPVKTGIQYSISNSLILSFPWKRESSVLIDIPPYCHSHVNGNPILLFVNNWKALYFVNQWKVLFFVILVKTWIQYFYQMNPLILSFPRKRESSIPLVIPLFCHSRENGNPLF